MNFLTLEYFSMTAKEKSFTRAAEKLHVTQQTLSASISALEKEVGNQLFVRHVPLELTYAGQVFLQYAEVMMKNQTALFREMQDIAQNEKGILKVGIGNTRGRVIMPGIIDAFQTRYPNYSIEITEGSNAALQKILSQGDIDVAIAVFSEEFPGLDLYSGYEEHTVLVIASELLERLFPDKEEEIREQILKGNLSELHACPFVLCRTEDMTGKVAGFFLKSSGIQPPVKALSDNIETLISLCQRGAGACLCPDNLLYSTLTEEQLGKLIVFKLPKDASYDVKLGIRKGNNWKIAMEFIEVAQKNML